MRGAVPFIGWRAASTGRGAVGALMTSDPWTFRVRVRREPAQRFERAALLQRRGALAAAGAAGEDLSGVQPPFGVERAAHTVHHREVVLGEQLAHHRALLDAHPMFT